MRTKKSIMLGAVAAIGLMSSASAAAAYSPEAGTPTVGAQGRSAKAHRSSDRPPVRMVVITPAAGDVAGSGGTFNIDLSLQAQNGAGNRLLSESNGYKPFFNEGGSSTFGPGKIDPGAPGLVVTLSSTPAEAGGPQANLAGVFQLNAVARRHGLIQTFNDWQVGVPGFFGTNRTVTMTVYAVRGMAPGVVPATGGPRPISNVVHETFHIG
jgi:opacity protein-like surface antigen